jgi:DNA-binding MarR family transcriptional regulator
MISSSKNTQEQTSVESSTGYWVTRLARVMEGDFEKRLEPHGVTRASCAILNAIFYDKQSTPAALASFIGIDGAAITRHLDRIEKQGLIEREPSPTDRRSVILKLTRKGTRLVPKLAAKSQETNTKFLEGLTRSERESFLKIAQKMIANADLTPRDIY